jgi:hypothetical protein
VTGERNEEGRRGRSEKRGNKRGKKREERIREGKEEER